MSPNGLYCDPAAEEQVGFRSMESAAKQGQSKEALWYN